MVVRIEEIKESGLRLTDPVKEETLRAALCGELGGGDTGFRPAGPAAATVTLKKVGSGVLVDGEVQVRVKAPCKRCLTEVEQTFPAKFMLNLVPERHAAQKDDEDDAEPEHGERPGTFELETADQETFDGKTIDLDPILREQVLLALPMDLVCREDCKGLCPSCGQNLNVEKCACEPKGIDPRLAALKNIKLN